MFIPPPAYNTIQSSSATTAPALSQADMEAVRDVVNSLVAAWNAHDAKAFSARYMDDGSFTNILGMTSFTRQGFKLQHERIFAGIYRTTHLAVTIDRVKLLRPDVVLLDTTTVLTGFAQLPPGITPGADGALHTKLQMVLLRQADGWWVASFHNVAVSQALPPQH